MSLYTQIKDTHNENHIRLYARSRRTPSRNVPKQFLSKPLRQLSKYQRHHRRRTIRTLYQRIQLTQGKLPMKKFFKSLIVFFEAMARAKAASVLARQGKIEEAKKIYN